MVNTTGRGHTVGARGPRVLAGILLSTLMLAGCGSGPPPVSETTRPQQQPTQRELTPAAEPGPAPPPAQPPAGAVVELPDGAPWGVAADHRSGVVAVALRSPGRLALLDIDTRQVRIVDAPGAARMLDTVAPGGPLLFPAENKDALFELALPSAKVLNRTPTGRQPHQAVRVADTTFVADEFGNQVSVLRDGRTVKRLPQPVQPGGITATAGRVAVVDVQANTLWVYDARTLRLVAALPAGAGPSHVKPVGGGRVAVSDVRGNAIMTYDLTGQPRQLDRVDVPGRAFGLKTDPQRGLVYTTLSNTNKLVQLRVAPDGSLQRLATLPTVRQPNSLDIDRTTGTVYVAGNADAQIQIIPATAFPPR